MDLSIYSWEKCHEMARNGDQSAYYELWARIYAQAARAFFTAFRKYRPSDSPSVATDLLHSLRDRWAEAIYIHHRKGAVLDAFASFDSAIRYIQGSAYNAIADHLRLHENSRVQFIAEGQDVAAKFESEAENEIEFNRLVTVAMNAVEAALGHVSELDRHIFYGVTNGSGSQSERYDVIGSEIGKSGSAVKKRFLSVRNALIDSIRKEFVEQEVSLPEEGIPVTVEIPALLLQLSPS